MEILSKKLLDLARKQKIRDKINKMLLEIKTNKINQLFYIIEIEENEEYEEYGNNLICIFSNYDFPSTITS